MNFDSGIGAAFGLLPGLLFGKDKKSPQQMAAPLQSGYQYNPQQIGPQVPQANYWQGGQFMAPGSPNPMMSSDILQRFPQLAKILSGGRPPMPGM